MRGGMARWKAAGIAAALAALAGITQAQGADERLEQALSTIKAYGVEMSAVLPCLYAILHDTKDRTDAVESAYGYTAVIAAVHRYEQTGGSHAEARALLKAFSDGFRPMWRVADLRAFVRACEEKGIFEPIRRFEQPLRLDQRPPFGGGPH